LVLASVPVFASVTEVSSVSSSAQTFKGQMTNLESYWAIEVPLCGVTLTSPSGLSSLGSSHSERNGTRGKSS
jgi:hypothetical protein